MADRIEVLRGPASVLYGQGAIGGVINVVPRKPSFASQDAEAVIGGGTDGRLNAAIDFNSQINDTMAYRLDASYRQADNWVDRGDSDSLALSGSVLWQPTDNLSITLSTDYVDRTDMQYFGTPLRDGRIDESLREHNYNVSDSDINYEDSSTRLREEWENGANRFDREGEVLFGTFCADTEPTDRYDLPILQPDWPSVGVRECRAAAHVTTRRVQGLPDSHQPFGEWILCAPMFAGSRSSVKQFNAGLRRRARYEPMPERIRVNLQFGARTDPALWRELNSRPPYARAKLLRQLIAEALCYPLREDCPGAAPP